MQRLGYYNGQWGPLEQMCIPMNDRASFFGDGVYDATMTCKGVILYADEHIDRFFRSAHLMRIEPDISAPQLKTLLHEMVGKVDAEETFLYWQMTRGTGLRRHSFPSTAPNLWITVVPEGIDDLSRDACAVCVEDTRFSHCNAKTLNLLPNVLAAQRAEEAGCDEAIFIREGYVTECAHSNVHILKEGTLITHPADEFILPGIARAHLIAMCASLDIPVEERAFSKQELFDADEVIVTSSSTFARGVSFIDGIAVGGGDRLRLALLQEHLTREFDTYIENHLHDGN